MGAVAARLIPSLLGEHRSVSIVKADHRSMLVPACSHKLARLFPRRCLQGANMRFLDVMYVSAEPRQICHILADMVLEAHA